MKKNIDIQLALTHQFQDPEWIGKFLLGGLVAIVPVLNFALIGYELRVVQRVSEHGDHILPKWDELGTYFQEGLMLGLARIIYTLPILFIFMVGFAIGGAFMAFGAALADKESSGAALMMVAFILLFGVVSVGILLGFAIGLIMPAMQAHYARQRTFAACFQFSEIFNLMRRNLNNYFLVYLTGFAANFILTFVFMFINFIPCLNYILLIVIGLPGVLWALTSQSHAIGQMLAADSSTNG